MELPELPNPPPRAHVMGGGYGSGFMMTLSNTRPTMLLSFTTHIYITGRTFIDLIHDYLIGNN